MSENSEEDPDETLQKFLKTFLKIRDKAILEQTVEAELKNVENEEENLELLKMVEEKEEELVYKCKQLQEQENQLTEVSKQLLAEKARVETIKKLFREEVSKRKKLIDEIIPSEEEIDKELQT